MAPVRRFAGFIPTLLAACCWRWTAGVRPGPYQGYRRRRRRATNQLIGYGLVVGLTGTGDKLDKAIFTRKSLIGMLERLGVNTRDQVAKLQTKNLAAVMVTAELPAFTHGGSRIDVAVSALGDATNLTGGTLLVTPLLAADGDVYAVAQGAVVDRRRRGEGRGVVGHPRRSHGGPDRQRRDRGKRGRVPAR